ncbi:hypothetical protein IEQ34_020836 [Dendrobium chrysotoxum]|uniref:Uncharacterized protein n=1 Tax=Dendrobium chrysotoxum TaxID=161865 RepID=A0AAV7G2F9_DENCH|nr:hypothetical protein IEQ34_020836 [Dendrobium chrysotoxum]
MAMLMPRYGSLPQDHVLCSLSSSPPPSSQAASPAVVIPSLSSVHVAVATIPLATPPFEI